MEENNKYELIIIGGGPAAVAAGVYAARKQLRTLIITKDFGGQSVVSEYLENWIGDISIKGIELKKKLEDSVKYYQSENFVIKEFQEVLSVEKNEKIFSVKTNTGGEYFSEAVLVTTGAIRRKLSPDVIGGEEFEHKGITYCASCDGPLFAGKDLVVIGGGNSGFESASQLVAYARSVTILQRSEKYKGEETIVKNILENEKVSGILNAQITEVFGDKFVKGIKYKNTQTGEEITLDVEGVFVEIGAVPATSFISDEIIEKDRFKQIIIDHRNGKTSLEGLWAAGDCTDSLFKQNAIAMGDGVKALEDIHGFLKG